MADDAVWWKMKRNKSVPSIYSDFDVLYDALELIAAQADNHKASVAYNDGENIALVNIRNIAQIALQQATEKSRAQGSFVRLKVENHQLTETVSQLAEALRLYGSRMPLSRAREDLQFNIDRALSNEI
jgi:hypothetical protein